MQFRISQERLISLLKSEAMLNGLNEAGVDNWGCYGDFDMFDKAIEIEEMTRREQREYILENEDVLYYPDLGCQTQKELNND